MVAFIVKQLPEVFSCGFSSLKCVVVWYADNEAPAGPVEQQRVDCRAQAEHPAGAGVPGASGNMTHIHPQLHIEPGDVSDFVCVCVLGG